MENMDRKVFDLEIDTKEIGDDGTFEGYGSVFGVVDRDGDIVAKGAFSNSLRKRTPALLWQHNPKEPIGKFLEAFEDDKGLRVKGKLSDIGRGAEALKLLRMGAINGLSVGFVTKQSERNPATGIRTILEAELMETSIVTFPANEDAIITAVKNVVPFQDLPILVKSASDQEPDTGREWNAETAADNIKAHAGDKPEVLKSAFLFADGEDDDLIYKGQIADVVNGELYIIPRAVFKAASDAVLSGSCNIDHIKRNIERYYAKMYRESPFVKGLGPSELGSMSPKELKTFACSKNFNVSGAGAEYISSMMHKGINSLRNSGANSQSNSDDKDAFVKGIKQLTKTLKGNNDG